MEKITIDTLQAKKEQANSPEKITAGTVKLIKVYDIPDSDSIAELEKLCAAIKAGTTTHDAARANGFYIPMSDHNAKLKKTDADAWQIWNIPAVITCPRRTKECEKYCYALQSERRYPSCSAARARNLELSRAREFIKRMIYTIAVNNAIAEKSGRRLNVRIHESGDFYNVYYTAAWAYIARFFENNNNIYFWAYTKSFDFFDAATAKILNIRGSVWADTTPAALQDIARLQLPIYTAYDAATIDAMQAAGVKFFNCACTDCANCRACINGKIEKIICEIH